MLPTNQGAIRLFRLAGIDVFLHWSWFVVAIYEVQVRVRDYRTFVWNVAEYVALFAIVTLHEFGHSLACRQVGGAADQIVLWPLGGVAYVRPPQRPGATLWSIAAGPLVNLVLFPVLSGLLLLSHAFGWPATVPDANRWLRAVWAINLGLLVFNLLPIYPLDGGQILRSLLWFVLGRARSLTVATSLGLVGVLGLGTLAAWARSWWLGILAGFVALSCWRGFRQARILAWLATLPRHPGFACPSCQTSPPIGPFWVCERCQMRFDTFEVQAICPQCHTDFKAARCLDCGVIFPWEKWVGSPDRT